MDDAGGEKKLKSVRRNFHQVEQKGQGNVDATEQTDDPREDKQRIIGQLKHRLRVPSREQHEAQGQKLGRVGKIVEGGDDDFGWRSFLGFRQTVGDQQLLRTVNETRQNDEELAGGERRDQGIP